MIPVTDLRAGVTFRDPQGLWEVVTYRHVKVGRGNATIRVKVRNLDSGSTIEKTFTSGQKVEDLAVAKKKGQFLYEDADSLVFMDQVSFEQFHLPKRIVGQKKSFLREGDSYSINVADDQILSIEIPNLVTLKIIETGAGVKGDTVSSTTKDAVLENGLGVKVPLFINQGDKIKVDTRTGEYVERVK